MNRVVIGLGSNIRSEENIEKARQMMRRRHRLVAESAFIETEPVGYSDQPNFLNGAVLIETAMGYEELEDWLKKTERTLGRVRGENKYGPRTIDLDIVVWNGKIVDPDVHARRFLRDAVLAVWPTLNI